MKRQEKFLLGLFAGAGAALAAGQLARARRGIGFGGRNVIIAGGSRGLGLVMARKLAAEGARLCLLARDDRELDRAKRLIEEETAGAQVLALRCDVRRRGDVRTALARVLAEWVAVDVLINVAGIIQVGPLEHMQHEDFENAMATHFWGPLNLMVELIPSMRRRGFGRIVNISSIGGRVAVPHLAPYSASKFALTGLSDAIRAELAPHGIRVTTACPGLMRTGSPINAQIKGQHQAEYAWFAIADSLPARAMVLGEALAPTLVARMMEMTTRLLPGPGGPEGDQSKRGRESESRWAPSVATTLTDRAAILNNEL